MGNFELIELFITHLRAALFLTFEKQAGLPVRLIESKSQDQDVVARLDASDSLHQALLQISFPRKTFLGLANHMLGEKEDKIGEGNISLAAELLNLIYASARTHINQAGYKFQPAIPYLVSDTTEEHSLNALTPILVSCECSMGVFNFEIRLRKSK